MSRQRSFSEKNNRRNLRKAWILRATIYLDANQREKAAEELKHYLRVEPNGAYAEEAKQLLSTW